MHTPVCVPQAVPEAYPLMMTARYNHHFLSGCFVSSCMHYTCIRLPAGCWGLEQPMRLLLLHRVGMEPPSIQVRFDRLTVHAKIFVGARATPTVFNAYRNAAEVGRL